MDRQGSSTEEGTHIDQGVETGLEERVCELRLGETTSYPERPGDPDCIYYLRTGVCGYGDRCRFNHPRDRSTSPVIGGGVRMSGGEFPDRSGQPICQYFVRTGSCKFGSSCKYHHPRQATGGSVSSFGLNIYGYPMRPGEKECSYYVKMGQCKFGVTCKFHHPQPANVPMPPVPAAASAVYPISSPAPHPYGVISGDWPVMRPSMMPGSFQGPYGPMLLSPGVVPIPGWAPYPAPNSVTTPNNPSTMGSSHVYGLTQLSPLAPAYTGSYQYANPSTSILKEQSFPQRPGQPECQYYLKTGECKFGSSCKYHHPAEWVAPESSSALTPMGLPLRPVKYIAVFVRARYNDENVKGTPTCSYYATHGVCKYGTACKFDHPVGTLSYSPSASSLSDMPVAPYPVGSLTGTLAASSSSSDLRTESISGPTKESAPTTTTSALSISTGSGGSVSSRTGSIPQSTSSGTKTTELEGASS